MTNISKILVDWYLENKRDLPWRNTLDPFKIWLSEVILQQTRVAQGTDYYLKFTKRFKNSKELSEASEDEVLALWKGLGYYSRGRNLRKAAIQIEEEFAGEFPKDFISLKKLKGVGDYSAAAIASFAYKEKVAVVDGNVYRVLSRLFNVDTPIDTGAGNKYFRALAQELISDDAPDMHNQAIMEFGALQCTPKSPNCPECPFIHNCEAYKANTWSTLPVKSKKIKRTQKYYDFFLVENAEDILLEKRDDKGIWANMYQLPLVEVEKDYKREGELLWEAKHVLTHQDLFCRFFKGNAKDFDGKLTIKLKDLENHALPRVIENFLERYYA